MWLLFRVLLFNLVIPVLLFGLVPAYLLRKETFPQSWTAHHLGSLPLLLVGVGLYLQCLWYLAWVGRGTPLPFDAPRKLVQRGPYAWVRNPLYLAIIMILTAEALFSFNLWVAFHAIAVTSALQLLVRLHEEEAMRRRFGAMYSDYCHQVPRWWPRRPRPKLETVPPFNPSR